MNKLAIFVEGQTEQIFEENLVLSLGDDANVGLSIERATGGSQRNPRRMIEITGASDPEGRKFFVLIVDCMQDNRVQSDIIENYDRLIAENYKHIVGIRDVFPHLHGDIKRIRKKFDFGLQVDPIKPLLILAIMETEAWFLAEHSHFPRIHAGLTIERIRQEFGFDPVHDDMQLRDHPSKDLENIYFLETMIYDKTRKKVERTVNSLDFSVVQNELAAKIDDLGNLVTLLRDFSTTP